MGYTIKKRTAYHEAAHALAALQLGIQFLAIHLGINGWVTLTAGQRHESFGSLELNPGYIRAKMDSAPEACIALLMAGAAAEKKMTGYDWARLGDYDEGDYAHAYSAAGRIVPYPDNGLDSTEFVMGMLHRSDRIIVLCREYQEHDLIWAQKNWPTIQVIGDALLASGTLGYAEVVQLVASSEAIAA